MNDIDLSCFLLYKDGELTPLGKAFLITYSYDLAQIIARIIFNHKKDGDSNDY